MIKADLSFITDVLLKIFVKLAFSLHSHWAASGLLSSYTTLPYCSLLALITLTPEVGHLSCVVIFVKASLDFSTSLPLSRSSRWLAGASGALSTRIYLLWVQL